MALCIRIDATADSIACAFAKKDLMHKFLAWFLALEENSVRDGKLFVPALDPGDDYYLAPYALVPQGAVHWLVFTGYKVRDPHYAALKKMGKHGAGCTLLSSTGYIEEGQLQRKAVPRDKWVAFRERAWAMGDDVCTKLEDHAFKTACVTLDIAPTDIPVDWRAVCAAKLLEMGGDNIPAPLATLSEWGNIPFTPALAAERESALRKRAREDAERHFQTKRARYTPAIASAIAKHKDVTPSETAPGAGCVCIFETDPFGAPGPFRCPYDRKAKSIFCAACKDMADKLAADASV